MADPDLEQIRKARLAQLQGSDPSGDSNPAAHADAQREREADARASVIAQILQPDAADRLNRIKLVKASRAADVEDRLIALARSGQLRGKVTEDQLKQLLAAMAEQEQQLQGGGKLGGGPGGGDAGAGGIQVVRRGRDDDDELDELMRELED